MVPKGLFITFEGGEGAGKTTSLTFAERWLRARTRTVVVTREPGGTPLGEGVRALLLHAHDLAPAAESELLLMFAARAEHLTKIIRPALAQGHVVLCDRFTDATYAYQGAGRGVATERIARIEEWVQGGLRPHRTLLFDVAVEVGLERARRRGAPDRFEREGREFLERVRQAYLERAAREPQRFRVIDAQSPRAEVERQIATALEHLLREHG